MKGPAYASRDKPIKGTTVLTRQDSPPNGVWKIIAEIPTEEAPKIIQSIVAFDDLLAACEEAASLLYRMGGTNHDPEYSQLLAAIAKAKQA